MSRGKPNKRYTPEFKKMVVETMKKEVIKLKEGNSVIYQDKTLMEKANVVSIDKKNGTAILSNKVIKN